MNDLQRKAIAIIVERYWGGHFQTGYDVENPQRVVIWSKVGPNHQALRHEIGVGGHIVSDNSEWDGKMVTLL